MEPSPRIRAQRSAARELTALAEHTPCIQRLAVLPGGRFKVEVDLPYLGRGGNTGDPQMYRGFKLAVRLPRGFPDEAPEVAFLADKVLFHPAVSPQLATFCLGNGVWTPDLGLAWFVALHLEAIVGLVDIDTLDGVFLDPNCAEAAKYYRKLRQSDELPLARPRFLSKPASPRPSSACPETERNNGSPGLPLSTGGKTVTVRSPTGRRLVSTSESEETGERTASCCLGGRVWRASLSPAGESALAWLRSRIERDTDLRLAEIQGGFALKRVISADAALTADAAHSHFERALRQLDLPVQALSNQSIAEAVASTLSHTEPKGE
jgi:hypothetical protein